MQKFQFTKDFMNTTLAIDIVCDSQSYALSAAQDAFFLVDRIENALSLYRDSSDVFAINIAKIDEEVQILDYTMDCLALASELYSKTLGAVDVCMGQFFTNAKAQTKIEKPQRIALEIDKENFLVKKTAEGYLDFGAIGKGYAVDKIVELLKNTWLIENAFINFGSSTLFALGLNENNSPWEISLNGVDKNFTLENSHAIASSSLRTQANHIIDPISLKSPKDENICYFAIVKDSASYADALSTAFTILSESEISEICSNFSAKFLKY